MPSRPPKHRPAKLHLSDGRPSAARRGYDAAWRVLRATYLASHPLCQACKRRDALHVDHKTAIGAGGSRLDERNLQALCHSCHSRKTVERDGGLGRPKGKVQ